MFVVRPVAEIDTDQIYELSAHANIGLTTLPHDYEVLKGRIIDAVKSFQSNPKKPGLETFIFVLEDLSSHNVIGTSAVISKVGGFEPNYTYKICTVEKYSKILDVRKNIQYLQLRTDHNGPSEIGSLFLNPEYRGKGQIGRLLALHRFLFMAQYSFCFEKETIVELRGTIGKEGKSVFWEALGKHFFEVEFMIADLMVMKDKSFIADLMPKHPIYIPLLPEEAQKVIGKVHEKTIPAFNLLQQEGFRSTGEVDIFEAGPVLACKTKGIRTVKESKLACLAEIHSDRTEIPENIIANVGDIRTYRSCVGHVRSLSKSEVSLSKSVVEALLLKMGDGVRFAPIRSKR